MDTPKQQIAHLPIDKLYDVARNPGRAEFREAAIELLLDRGARFYLRKEDIQSQVEHARRRRVKQ